MTGLFVIFFSAMGGAIGWWLGERLGFMTAFLLSVVGSALGVYYGRKLAKRYLP